MASLINGLLILISVLPNRPMPTTPQWSKSAVRFCVRVHEPSAADNWNEIAYADSARKRDSMLEYNAVTLR